MGRGIISQKQGLSKQAQAFKMISTPISTIKNGKAI